MAPPHPTGDFCARRSAGKHLTTKRSRYQNLRHALQHTERNQFPTLAIAHSPTRR